MDVYITLFWEAPLSVARPPHQVLCLFSVGKPITTSELSINSTSVVQWPENGDVGALLANRLLHVLGAGESSI